MATQEDGLIEATLEDGYVDLVWRVYRDGVPHVYKRLPFEAFDEMLDMVITFGKGPA